MKLKDLSESELRVLERQLFYLKHEFAEFSLEEFHDAIFDELERRKRE